jgi:hypothetical protein
MYRIFSRIMEMVKKMQHGGKRPGAGRKPVNPEGATVILTATVPGSLVDDLDRVAKARGWNRSQAVTEAVRGLVKGKGRK